MALVAKARTAVRKEKFDPLAPLGVLLIIFIWWMVSAAEAIDTVYLPALPDVLTFVLDNFGRSDYIEFYGSSAGGIGGNLLYTSTNVLGAVIIAGVLGVSTGILSVVSPTFKALISPVVLISGTLPVLVLGPFFLIAFGLQRWTQLVIIALYCAPILYSYTRRAVINNPIVYEDNAVLLGASESRVVREIYIPGGFPEILGGIRITLAVSWGLAAIAEMLGAETGLGRMIVNLATSSDVTGIVACTLCLAVVGICVDLVVVLASKFITRWR